MNQLSRSTVRVTGALRSYLDETTARLELALCLLTGRNVRIKMGEPEIENPIQLRVNLPERVVGLGFELGLRDHAWALCLLERSVADRLAGLMTGAPAGSLDTVEWGQDPDPRAAPPDPRAAFTPLADIFAASLARSLAGQGKDARRGRMVFLEGTTWEDGGDPLGGGSALVVPIWADIAEAAEGTMRLVLPWPTLLDQLREPVPAVAEPLPFRTSAVEREPASSSPIRRIRPELPRITHRPSPRKRPRQRRLPTIVCVAPVDLALALKAGIEGAQVETFESFDGAEALLEQGPSVSLLIGWIARDDAQGVERLANLSGKYGFPHRIVFVILEEPILPMVVQCGRFGFLNVLPGSVPPDVLVRKVRGISVQTRPPTPRPRRGA